MKIIVQRVKNARVTNDTIDNQINKGYCLLVGVGQNSTEEDVKVIARKIAHARLFEDENDKLNLNIQQVEGEILSVSQFTIYADVKRGIDLDSQILKLQNKLKTYIKNLIKRIRRLWLNCQNR